MNLIESKRFTIARSWGHLISNLWKFGFRRSIKAILSDSQITVEVLSASDLTPQYLACVRPYIESWNSYPYIDGIKYVPRVMIISDKIPESFSDISEYMQLVHPRELNPVFVAQSMRLLETRNSTADYVMTSDIDMLPLSLKFESGLLKSGKVRPQDFIILRDVLSPGQYPICYSLADPKTWSAMITHSFSGMTNHQILSNFLNISGGSIQYSGEHGGLGWTLDQELLWKLVQENTDEVNAVKFKDKETKHRRLDRSRHRGIRKWPVAPLVFFGYFTDYHVHHPIESHSRYVRLLIFLRNAGLRIKG